MNLHAASLNRNIDIAIFERLKFELRQAMSN